MLSEHENEAGNPMNWEGKYHMLHSEFQEYQEFSRSLEDELQLQLKQQEKELGFYRQRAARFEQENATLFSKLKQLTGETHVRIQHLTGSANQSQKTISEMKERIRSLEQANDSLEKSNRALQVSIKDTERTRDEILEKNALLESQIEEQANDAFVQIQRLRDDLTSTVANSTGKESAFVERLVSTTEQQAPHLMNQPTPQQFVEDSNVNVCTRQSSVSAATLVTGSKQDNVIEILMPTKQIGYRHPFNDHRQQEEEEESYLHGNGGHRTQRPRGNTMRFLQYLIGKIDNMDNELTRCCKMNRSSI